MQTPMRAIAAMLAVVLPSAAMAEQANAAQPCVAPDDAAGLMLFLAPQAIAAAGTVCAGVLPPTSLLRQTSGPFVAKYQAAADAAWSSAKRAMGQISGNDNMAPLLQTDQAKPMIAALLTPLITKAIKVKDCKAIDHMVTLLAPLPARNTADLVVAIVQLSDADRVRKGEKSDLPICPGLTS